MLMNKVAEKYSQAVFEVAIENNLLSDFYNQLIEINRVFSLSENIDYFLNPMIKNSQKFAFLNECFTGFDKRLINFIGVLIKNKRLNLINDVFNSFRQLYFNYENIKLIKIKSSYELTDDEKRLIFGKLTNKFGNKIVIDYFVDESLKLGYIMEIDNKVLDTSIKTKLSKLKIAMSGGGN